VYQRACADVIERFDGHIAQYLGDGLLIYFGYPQVHEDDTDRAVRTGLGIIDAIERSPPAFPWLSGWEFTRALWSPARSEAARSTKR
jgi:class 3 adenylate cyclase